MTKQLLEFHVNKLKDYYRHSPSEFPPEGNEYSLFLICIYLLEQLDKK